MTGQFVGRETELEELKAIWTQVRAEKKPQVVNYIADTGVGKTRLIQAFYEWLSTDPQQGDGKAGAGYWPDDLGTGRQRVVNPALDRFKEFDVVKRRIPWLWWGMYWTDAPNDVSTALIDTSSYLDVHLKLLEINRTTDTASREALLDLAMDFAKTAAEAVPGIGTLVKPAELVYKLGKKLWDNREKRIQAQQGVAADQESQSEVLANELLTRLKATFESTNREVPMVIFLDDVHFATDVSQDVKTLQFLDSLLRQASLWQWPLLVITTHWKSPWQAHLNAKLDGALPWRRLEEAIKCDETKRDRITFHDKPLTKLPGDSLRQVALSHLPGLSDANQTTILEKVDNVRWLVEVLNALKDNKENFESADRNQPLSRLGLERLTTCLAEQGYIGVIRQRLMGDAMYDVRHVLGATAWHTQGLEFVGPLADAFESRLIEQKLISSSGEGARVLSILMQAINPASLIEGESKSGELSNLIRFPERGYLEVARELFDKSHVDGLSLTLGQRVIEWMEPNASGMPRWQQFKDQKIEKVFLAIAIEVLRKLQPHLSPDQSKEIELEEKALRKQLDKGRLTEEEFNQDLEAAKATLLANADGLQLDNAGRYEAIAMAELASLLYVEGQGQAWELAFGVAKHPDLAAAKTAMSEASRALLLTVWTERADCWLIAKNWASSRIQSLGANETPERLIDITISLKLLADLDRAAGATAAARQGYQKSLAVGERLLAEFGDTPARLLDITVSLERLADLDRATGATAAARQGYQKSLAIGERLLAEFGETPERLRGITVPLERLADLDWESGDPTAARKGYQKCLVIRERLVTKFCETPRRLRDISVSLFQLAYLDQEAGDSATAREGYLKSLLIIERLLDEFGETPARLLDISVSLERLADLDRVAGATAAARQGYQKSLAIREHLLAEFGETPERLRGITVPLERLADLDRVAGATAAARQGYQKSLAIREHLLAEFGETPERLRGITVPLERLADLDRVAGATAAARQGYQKSLAIGERLLAEFGETPERLRGITVPLERLAGLDRVAGATAAARQGYQKSLAIGERLLAEFGETPERLRDIMVPVLALADLDQTAGDTSAARHGYQKSLAIGERLLTEFGETPGRLRDIMVPVLALADLDQTAGDTSAARHGYQKSLAIGERLLTEFGETPERLRSITVPLNRLADLDHAAGNTMAARQGFQRILVVSERLLAEFGETPDRLRVIAVPHQRLADLDREAGSSADARRGYQKTLAILERLIDEFGATPARLRDITELLERLADLDRAAGDTTAALQGVERLMSIRKRISAKFGEMQ